MLFAIACLLLTLPGGDRGMAGALPWLFACLLTISARTLRVLYGSGALETMFSPGFILLTTAEVALVGAAVGATRDRVPERWAVRNVVGASALVVWIACHALLPLLLGGSSVLAARLGSGDLQTVRTAIEEAQKDGNATARRALVESIPTSADNAGLRHGDDDPRGLVNPERSSHSWAIVTGVTRIEGIGFWPQYLRSEKGRRSSAALCGQILQIAGREAGWECSRTGKQAMLQAMDLLTAEASECFVREVRAAPDSRAARTGLGELLGLALYFPWVLDRYGELLAQKTAEAARSENPPYNSFPVPLDPTNLCGGKRIGRLIRGLSDEDIALGFKHMHDCPLTPAIQHTLQHARDCS